MAITIEDVKYMANLACLEIDAKEVDFYAQQLSRILELMNQMQHIDTNNISPMSHPHDFTLRLREDVVTEENHRDDYQAIAPETENGLYLVPKVID